MVKKLYSAMDFPLKTRLALFFNNVIYKTSKDSTLGINEKNTSISEVLFILPEETKYSRIVRIFLQSIYNALAPNPSIKIDINLSKHSMITYEG